MSSVMREAALKTYTRSWTNGLLKVSCLLQILSVWFCKWLWGQRWVHWPFSCDHALLLTRPDRGSPLNAFRDFTALCPLDRLCSRSTNVYSVPAEVPGTALGTWRWTEQATCLLTWNSDFKTGDSQLIHVFLCVLHQEIRESERTQLPGWSRPAW